MKMREFVPLGSKVRDVISGIEGIAVGVVQYLNGCRQVYVESPGKDSKRVTEWFDEQRVEVLERSAFTPQPSAATAGGEVDNPPSGTAAY